MAYHAFNGVIFRVSQILSHLPFCSSVSEKLLFLPYFIVLLLKVTTLGLFVAEMWLTLEVRSKPDFGHINGSVKKNILHFCASVTFFAFICEERSRKCGFESK